MMGLAPRRVWLVVVLFAVAMAWMEAATVYYIRLVVDRIVPYQPNPLPVAGVLGAVELVREAATLVMLVTVGLLAGRTGQQRLGYTAVAFGVWDILYYAFLRVMTGWPASLLDWDILFLLPLPWWGPVLAPMSIALLLVVWGTFATQARNPAPAGPLTPMLWTLNGLGMGLALYIFMADAIRALPQGIEATTHVLPTSFNWPLFGVALALMVAPGIDIVRSFLPQPENAHRTGVRPGSDQGQTPLDLRATSADSLARGRVARRSMQDAGAAWGPRLTLRARSDSSCSEQLRTAKPEFVADSARF
jgi:hypothetical protein